MEFDYGNIARYHDSYLSWNARLNGEWAIYTYIDGSDANNNIWCITFKELAKDHKQFRTVEYSCGWKHASYIFMCKFSLISWFQIVLYNPCYSCTTDCTFYLDNSSFVYIIYMLILYPVWFYFGVMFPSYWLLDVTEFFVNLYQYVSLLWIFLSFIPCMAGQATSEP